MSRSRTNTNLGLDQAFAEVRNRAIEEAARLVERSHIVDIDIGEANRDLLSDKIRDLKRGYYPNGRWVGIGKGRP